ncbi:MAG: tetratricopeptide repeat protein [Ignavibacteriales bacterium]|nr:tetratricopeptide repeat protein [Ignavibacteriales bacterium]
MKLKLFFVLFIYSTLALASVDSLKTLLKQAVGVDKSNALIAVLTTHQRKKDNSSARILLEQTAKAITTLRESNEKNILIGMYAEECKKSKYFNISSELFSYYFGNATNYTSEKSGKYIQMYADVVNATANRHSAANALRPMLLKRQSIADKEFVSQLLYTAGNFYWKNGILDTALFYMQENLSLQQSFPASVMLGWAYHSLGNLYWRMGKLDDAYNNYTKGLSIHEQFNDTLKIIVTHNNLGLIFQRLRYFDYAMQNIERALKLAEKKSDNITLAYTLKRLSDLYIQQNELVKADSLLRKSAMIYRSLNAVDNLTGVYLQFGRIYQLSGDNDKALDHFMKSFENAKKEADNFNIAAAGAKIGEVLLLLGREKKAEFYLETARKIADANDYRVILRNIYKQFSLLYKQQNHPDKALYYLEMYLTYKDSVINEIVISSINESNTRQIIRSSEEERQHLQRSNELQKKAINVQSSLNTAYLVIIVVITILLLLSIAFYHRLNLLTKRVEDANRQLTRLNKDAEVRNAELTEANATKEKLFSIIAHDLKNPFNSIFGFTEIINSRAKETNDAELIEFSSLLLFASQKLVSLINDLTQWSVMQNGKLIPVVQSFDLIPEIKDVVGQVVLEANLKNIAIITELPETKFVFADKDMILTVVRNLLVNAIKFTPDDGRIILRGVEVDGFFALSVIDSGTGMNDTLKQSILNGGDITSTLGTQNEKGSGIGLTVCREFIKVNNGLLDINSTPRRGTEFIVSIPLTGDKQSEA